MNLVLGGIIAILLGGVMFCYEASMRLVRYALLIGVVLLLVAVLR